MNNNRDDGLVAAERLQLLTALHDAEKKNFKTLYLSTHGLLLQYDITRSFVAGAWLSVIVLAQAAIEASIRDIETQDHQSNAQTLFADNSELQRIRKLRNELVHPLKPGRPSLAWNVPNGDFVACHELLEEDAKISVKHMFRVMYAQSKSN